MGDLGTTSQLLMKINRLATSEDFEEEALVMEFKKTVHGEPPELSEQPVYWIVPANIENLPCHLDVDINQSLPLTVGAVAYHW